MYDGVFKVSQDVLKSVENEKKSLLSQLRDYEWRLEQENKVDDDLFVLHRFQSFLGLSSSNWRTENFNKRNNGCSK